MGRQRVDAAADVDPAAVDHLRVVPGALGHRDDARHDARRNAHGETHNAAVVEDIDRVAVLYPALSGVDRVHVERIRVEAPQLREIMESGVNAAVTVKAEALEGILLLKQIARHIPGAPEFRNRIDAVAFGEHPVGRFLRELLGIDLDPARGSLERMRRRILPEGFERNRVLAVVPDFGKSRLPEFIKSKLFCRRTYECT